MTKRQQSKKQKLPKIAKDPNEYLEAQRWDHQSHLQAWTPSGGICGLIYTSRHPTLYHNNTQKTPMDSYMGEVHETGPSYNTVHMLELPSFLAFKLINLLTSN